MANSSYPSLMYCPGGASERESSYFLFVFFLSFTVVPRHGRYVNARMLSKECFLLTRNVIGDAANRALILSSVKRILRISESIHQSQDWMREFQMVMILCSLACNVMETRTKLTLTRRGEFRIQKKQTTRWLREQTNSASSTNFRHASTLKLIMDPFGLFFQSGTFDFPINSYRLLLHLKKQLVPNWSFL